ncbi:MAG TPA: SDR family oxidoreductase [Ramlibacter sp.]|uniref:SDR family NAD(P)-dependent oxidoreductase n=1 Tax=Ramlibacter sp. TaxID=1917967 RepID=UPI002B687BDF|nr:SDR family oxidoreductase [Ramlibacter sp.]HVZ45815.1 SDR family oxidoreductase [Ramlibacter sp.]
MRFKDKSALVVGASEGIGLACARMMAGEGATVFMIARDAARLAAAAQSVGPRAVAIACDATNAPAVASAVRQVLETAGRVDVLVNAVGGSTIVANAGSLMEDMALEDWQQLFSFNLDPMFLFSKAVIPAMKQQRGGSIVNLSSLASRGTGPMVSAAYVGSKAAVTAVTRKMAFELGPDGIRVNSISPGLTLSARLEPTWDRLGEAGRAELCSRIPLRRVATPEDQARVICFLCSEDAGFVTGVNIDVTGGQ